jgi:hypothetical protein
LAKSPEFFADPSIVEQIGKGLPAEGRHLEPLLAIKETFMLEKAKPLFDRTVAIYNAEFYEEVLNDALDRVEAPPDNKPD